MSTNKLLNSWREFVASSSFNCIAQVVRFKDSTMCSAFDKDLRFVSKFLLRDQVLRKRKMRWSDNNDETSTKRMNYIAHRESLTKLSENVAWKEANNRKRKEIEFKQIFRIIYDSSSNLWRLIRWARIRNHKSRNTSKISNLLRRDAESNALVIATNFEFKIRLLFRLFFSNTIEIDFIDMSSFNYFNVVSKSSLLITKNEIRQTIKRCKSNNASESDDILNRIFKILVDKLMSHLMSLFRVCAALSYYSRCFREIHIIILKKSKKKNYTNVKTYKSIALLNTVDKVLKSVIARRINDLTKTRDLLFVNQMSERKSRSCETVLKLLTKQIHTIWNMNKNKITTLLSMNVIEAYDHVSRERLLHNLKKKRISTWIVI
jgi:hypothetical protein